MRRIVKYRGSTRDEKLRYFLLVQVPAYRLIRRCAPAAHNQQDLMQFHQRVGDIEGFQDIRVIVHGHESELATVDSPLIIDHLKVASLGAPDGTIFSERARIRHDVAELDFGVGYTGIVCPL